MLKDNFIPSGTVTDILPGSAYHIWPMAFDYNYRYAVYAAKDDGIRSRFFISGDSARSWVEDSSFPTGVDVKINKLWQLDYGIGADAQTGIVAATDKGLFYHPHNIINGTYWAAENSRLTSFSWGPGIILVNGDVTVWPKESTPNSDPPFWRSELRIKQDTKVKFTYNFKAGTGVPSPPALTVNSALVRDEGDNDDPNLITYFTSSRSLAGVGDWVGIVTAPYPILVGDSICNPSTDLWYCTVKDARIGITGRNNEGFAVNYSRILSNRDIGIQISNGSSNFENFLFLVTIDNCTFLSNPQYGVYINAYEGFNDCDWKPVVDPQDPYGRWDPHKGLPNIECINYFTFAWVTNNNITSSDVGVFGTGTFGSIIGDNKISTIGSYGIELRNGVLSWVPGNEIWNDYGLNLIAYSGLLLDHVSMVTVEGNDIQKCKKAGIEIVGKAAIHCMENYIHANSFSNVYIQDAFPYFGPRSYYHTNALPNSLIDAQFGCYIIRTDFTNNVYTAPTFYCNRIKKYGKSGVYVERMGQENYGPYFGNNQYYGLNSIAEGTSATSWNFIRNEMQVYFNISAVQNWWGSDNPSTFRISPYVIYSPWRSTDPYPGVLPKLEIDQPVAPNQLEISSAYPNPFNPDVTIEFNNPSGSNVSAQVFDILGRQVKALANGFFSSGTHKVIWDGRNESGKSVNSGVYFVKFTSEGQCAVKKVTFLK